MSIKSLLTEDLESFTIDNMVTLYHYAPVDQEKLTLTTDRFGSNPWSRNELKASTTPKIFFYLDPVDQEKFFKSDYLYSVDVDRDVIYNVLKDPLGLKSSIREKNNGALNIDTLIDLIIRHGYKGMYYKPKRELVAWFENITVYREYQNTETQQTGKRETMNSEQIIDVVNNNFISIISAYRSYNNRVANQRNHQKLESDLKQLGYNFTEAEGGYIEQYDGESHVVEEPSFFVWDEDKKPFTDDMKKLGVKYDQESIVLKSPYKLEAYLYGTSEGSDFIDKDQVMYVGKFKPNTKDIYYTRIGDFTFTFG